MLCDIIFYLFLSVILTRQIGTQNNFLHKQLQGNIVNNSGLNFSILLKDLNGLVFYGIDSNNKFAISIHANDNKTLLIIKFNNLFFSREKTNFSHCKNGSYFQLTFILHLIQSQVTLKCKDLWETFTMNVLVSDQFASYPIPLGYNESANNLYIWMGNIGPYVGRGGMVTLPLKRALNGCLDNLYFNDQLIKMEKGGTDFLFSCDIHYNENKLIRGLWTNVSVIYKLSDCSSYSMNGKYCRHKLVEYLSIDHKYPINTDKELMRLLRLEWRTRKGNKNYCLMEIYLSDESIISFYVSQYQELFINTFGNKSRSQSVVLNMKLKDDEHYIISINMDNYPNLAIRIFDGENITTIIDEWRGMVTMVNLGFFRNTYTVCKNWDQDIYFEHETEKILNTNLKRNPVRSSPGKIFVIVMILLAIPVILSFLCLVLCKFLRSSKIFERNPSSIDDKNVTHIPVSEYSYYKSSNYQQMRSNEYFGQESITNETYQKSIAVSIYATVSDA